MSDLREGDLAPAFQLPDEAGTVHSLKQLISSGPLVMFFYPKDETAVCTKEACGFRDDYSEFVSSGAEIVGISRDDARSHASFRARHNLPFPLLCDDGGRVAALYGVKKMLGVMPGRTTFVIDTNGTVRLNYTAALNAGQHIARSLAAVRALKSPAS